MQRLIYILFLLLNLPLISMSQKSGKAFADSLIYQLPAIKDDTAIAKALNRITLIYTEINLDTAYKYAEQFYTHTKQMKWQRGIAAYYTAYANILSKQAKHDEELLYNHKALTIFREIKDTLNIAGSYNNLGSIEHARGNYSKAVEYYSQSLKVAEKSNNLYNISIALENISLAWYDNKDYNLSLAYSKKALAVKQAGLYPKEQVPTSWLIIGDNYRELQQYDSAKKYYDNAIEGYKESGDQSGLGTAYNSMANLYASTLDYQQAISYATQSKQIFSTISESFEDAEKNLLDLGRYHLAISKKDNLRTGVVNLTNKQSVIHTGINYLLKAKDLAAQNKHLLIYSESLKYLSQGYEEVNDFRNSLAAYKEYRNIQDSIFSQSTKNAMAQKIVQLEIDKKDTELKVKDLQLLNQKKQKLFYTLALAALFIVGLLLYSQSRLRKKTNNTLLKLNTELDEANTIKTRFFGIISHDLRSPIATLINYLHLQKSSPELLDEKQKLSKNLVITKAAENLLEEMETMLLWSKSQMAHFSPTYKVFAIEKLFSRLNDYYADKKGIQFEYKAPDGYKIYSDEDYLFTIMQNLTSNAIKALKDTDNGHVKWEAIKLNDKTILSIEDNGPGITTSEIAALTMENAKSNSKSGFGMHIIRDLTKAINCTISYETMEPGTKCTLVLT